MRRSDSEYPKVAVEWKPTGKRPKRRSKKRRMDETKQDSKKIGTPNWKENVQNPEEWKEVLVAAKTLEGL